MIIYFADRTMNIIGQASTQLPQGLMISDDTKIEDVESGVKTLEFDVEYDDRKNGEKMTAPGNYLLRSSGNEAEFYTLIDSELKTDAGSVHVYGEDAGLDMLNVVVGPYEAHAAETIAEYVTIFCVDTGFTIGVNEVSTYSRKLTFEGEATVAERLKSLATAFDAEISFSFDIDRFHVVHKKINFWKKRGKDAGEILRVGEHISRLRITKSVANLATGLYVTGGTPEGSTDPITLSGYSYDDGDIYVSGDRLLCRSALAKWSRYLSPDETGSGLGHIIKRWNYDTTSKAELCTRAVTQLKKITEMEVNYEAEVIDLPESVKVGDTIQIADEEGALYLQARVLQLKTMECKGKREITLGDYMIKESGLNGLMVELSKRVTSLSKRRTPEAVVTVETTSIDYSTGAATLKATLRVDGVITTPTSYSWTKGDSTTVIGTNQTLTVSDLNAVYHCTCEWG